MRAGNVSVHVAVIDATSVLDYVQSPTFGFWGMIMPDPPMDNAELKAIGDQFGLSGEFVSATPYGSGHINDTYLATYDQGNTQVRFILQRLNTKVFKNPDGVMSNIALVTDHQRQKLRDAGCADTGRRVLTLVKATDGANYVVTCGEDYWRIFLFIEGASTYDNIDSVDKARQAAAAFARFQLDLEDFPAKSLNITIPDFHNTPQRYQQLLKAVEDDPAGRAALCQPEIEFAVRNEPLTSIISDLQESGDVPVRIVHNDTKLNNVMLDDKTGEGICVIDLDTVMPGTVLTDFGDMVRSATIPGSEDGRDLSRARVRLPLFEAIASGYIGVAGKFLNTVELEHLAVSSQVITIELGMRFLADYLTGDTYFKTNRENHNLDRCRTQFALAEDMERQMQTMTKRVTEIGEAQ